MPYTLITANRNYSSWSLRPWLLMKALGIPFAERFEPFTKPDNYEDFRRFSPTGQVPLLIDGSRKVPDSLGITLYLADRHPGIWPADPEARIFAIGAVCEMHGGLGHLRSDCTMNVGVRVTPRLMSEGLQRNVERVREIFTEGLERFCGPWLAGAEISAVDAFYAPVAFRVRSYGLEVGKGQAWVDHVLAHPAMLDWEAQALAEQWREEAHEAELAAAGAITVDYRK
ncbi:MAG: glutathione S-transferase family protein [Novosphingobium sp.]